MELPTLFYPYSLQHNWTQINADLTSHINISHSLVIIPSPRSLLVGVKAENTTPWNLKNWRDLNLSKDTWAFMCCYNA